MHRRVALVQEGVDVAAARPVGGYGHGRVVGDSDGERLPPTGLLVTR